MKGGYREFRVSYKKCKIYRTPFLNILIVEKCEGVKARLVAAKHTTPHFWSIP